MVNANFRESASKRRDKRGHLPKWFARLIARGCRQTNYIIYGIMTIIKAWKTLRDIIGVVWANCVPHSVCFICMFMLALMLISPRQTNNKINELKYLCVSFFSFQTFFFRRNSSAACLLPRAFFGSFLACLLACLPVYVSASLAQHGMVFHVCVVYMANKYANHCITNTWTIARHHINFGWSFFPHYSHALTRCMRAYAMGVCYVCQSSSLSWKTWQGDGYAMFLLLLMMSQASSSPFTNVTQEN